MNDKEINELIDLLYPFFIKKLKSEGLYKTCIKSTNASVSWVNTEQSSNINQTVKVKLPYDTAEIQVINKSTAELSVGDTVCLHYNIDLKNAYVAYKV